MPLQETIKILFLTANPQDTRPLQIDQEMRAVDQALRLAEYRDRFDLRSHWAVRYGDLQELLLRHKPHIVHFSGHGSQAGEIILDSDSGTHPVAPEALGALLSVLTDNLRCAVLNACYSDVQAHAIAEHIDCVIGMASAIGDTDAIHFASAFYLALGYGRSVKEAFDLGCNAIDLANLADKDIPHLLALHGDPAQVMLVAREVGAAAPDTAPAPGESPYKGLEFYDVGDADIFFGREQLTATLVSHVRHQRLLAVVGASGSGKSSLVRAGLVPALQRGESLVDGTRVPDGSARWPIHIITPTAHPLKALAASLTRDSDSVTATITLIDDLARDARSLDICADRMLSRQALTTPSAADCLLLVVDQLEELFTLCRDKSERKAFIDNLLTAAGSSGQTVVVLTLRADFYAHCSEFDNLRTALERYQCYIGPMSHDELRRAIEEPARLGGWALEPGLVDLMLQDVDDEPGALPLLSHALLETWKRRRGRTLTLAGYSESGRVQGAIAKTAETVLRERLTPEQRLIARNIFLRLTELGEGTQDTRRRIDLDELIPKAEDKSTVEIVLKTLVDARLVTTFQEEAEVAHEALIREWPTLREWLSENRDWLRLHHRLTKAAREWEEQTYALDLLYRRTSLEQTLEKAKGHEDELNELERSFLKASQDALEAKEREKEAARQRELEQLNALTRETEARRQAEAKRAEEQAMAAEKLRRRAWYLAMALAIATAAVIVTLYFFGLARERLDDLRVEQLLRDARELKAAGDAQGAIENFNAVAEADPSLAPSMTEEISDTLRYVATKLTGDGEALLRNAIKSGSAELRQQAIISATALFSQALVLNPPPDTHVYVWIPPGEFTMGSTKKQIDAVFNECQKADSDCQRIDYESEAPQHKVALDGFWIMRTEVTNALYKRCVEASVCEPPDNIRWDKEQFAKHPVTDVDWNQAQIYAAWVGGRLPTEAEWEKACRGTDGRIYPWGNEEPTQERLNNEASLGTWTNVGSYPPGANGLYDMAGNVWEWTADWYDHDYYADSPVHNPIGPDSGEVRVLRGGSFSVPIAQSFDVRCAFRGGFADLWLFIDGFRVVSPGP